MLTLLATYDTPTMEIETTARRFLAPTMALVGLVEKMK